VDGNWHFVLARGGPIRNSEGRILYWAGINLDIQLRKEAERELNVLVQTLEGRIAERTRELEHATDKLRDLSGKLMQAQDEERRRIARELHDGVGQLLAAMNMNLSNLWKEKSSLTANASQSLHENAALIQQAAQEIRTLSHLLHPPLLDEVGLESALCWYVDGFAKRSKIKVHTQMEPGFSHKLPRDRALTLFRIAQESLTNVYRHSGSPSALVAVHRSASEITMEVKDEGRGIPEEIQAKISSGESSGVGLRGMRERARQFGGRLEVHSQVGGTRIVAILPVPEMSDAAEETEAECWVNDQEIDQEVDQEPPNRTLAQQPAAAQLYGRVAVKDPSPDAATILCIDDESIGVTSRKLLLESAGHRVLAASSGEEGIRIFQYEKIDAVILDYWMSGMKGTAVAAELKRINPAVPIIVLSGMFDLPGEASGIVDQWLVKGSHRAEHLLESIHKLLQRRPV
jgi:signal transduction histidine kinase